jgi:hypothetical protein
MQLQLCINNSIEKIHINAKRNQNIEKQQLKTGISREQANNAYYLAASLIKYARVFKSVDQLNCKNDLDVPVTFSLTLLKQFLDNMEIEYKKYFNTGTEDKPEIRMAQHYARVVITNCSVVISFKECRGDWVELAFYEYENVKKSHFAVTQNNNQFLDTQQLAA